MKPPNVPTMEEWLSFARQRLSKEHAVERLKKQELKAKNKTPHTMSRLGYAGLTKEMKEKSNVPDSITRVDVWIKAYKRKDKSYINEAAKEAAEQMEEYTNTTQSTGIHYDAISHVLGPKHRGRVRALGFGITKTKINVRNDVSRKYDRTIGALEQQLQQQHQIQQKMQQQIEALMSQIANNQSCPNAPPQVPPAEDVVYKKCELLHYNGSGVIVAKGEVDSTDLDDLIDDVPLGFECWKVYITGVIEPNVLMCRILQSYNTLEHVTGPIAWPSRFIKISPNVG
ncbi:uncharacterized protein LOC132273613 [Cornus florida]|uniref:uncharacterized protein LOC132273613 n=1 Tax=Cornus florida TaxID=4283 RepID=UPI002898C186|nr:uncharacterized protein LOC132273613 [Cornus florida]XP_059630575.1 uncharacterized protein LOC132273613 [Cornus florida]XP_059630576.1 uncharacterized protein LOC132273613 [Cornus florida]XP_059630577.1 uncharacterized protein LOC132273613 [Cornus florida]